MKDMLSNEHYCYEQYTPLMKSSAYLPPPPPPPTHTSIDNLSCMDPPHFYNLTKES